MKEKEKILLYSSSLFFKDGFHKTTIEELAKNLSISKNTVYKHFRNKDSLLKAVVKHLVSDINNKVRIIFNSDDDAISKLVNLLRFMSLNLMRINEKFFKDLQIHNPEVWLYIDNMRKKLMFDNLAKLIRQGKKEKIIIDYPDEIICTIFIASIRSIINPEFLLNNRFSNVEAFTYTFKILLNAILTDKGNDILKNLNLTQ